MLLCCWLCVQGYRQNELYAGAWIDVIVEHAFKGNSANDVFAAECLSVLLDENEQLLDQVITADVVAQFGQLLRQQARGASRHHQPVLVVLYFSMLLFTA